MKSLSETKAYLEKHKKRISPALFLSGFIFDLFTLNQVDQFFDNMILLGHLTIITVSIWLIHLGKRDQVFSNIVEKMIIFAPFTLVFSFGGVLSGYVIFYTKSASLFANWPFLFILYLLFISSEFIFNRYQQTLFQVGMWFAATLSFTIFFVPVIIKSVGPWVFLLSNLVSIVIGWLFIHILIKAYNPTRDYLAIVKAMFVFISLGFIGLYFLNVIPPIPLSMKESGMYHLIERTEGNTLVGYKQDVSWFRDLSPREEVSITPGSRIYGYTSIYAPSDIRIALEHVWEKKVASGSWQEFTRSSFVLDGGRQNGFRWYSFISPTEGSWRIRTLTMHGQEVGQTQFEVNHVLNTPTLEKQELE